MAEGMADALREAAQQAERLYELQTKQSGAMMEEIRAHGVTLGALVVDLAVIKERTSDLPELKRRVDALERSDSKKEGMGATAVMAIQGGWAVAIPTLIGIAIGLWIDRTWPSHYSWALMFLIIGLAVGCINAAYWVRKVRSKIIEDDE